MRKNITIFAPHPDDEIIGCYSVLSDRKVKRVVYFYELSAVRKKEARDAADRFGFIADFRGFQFPTRFLTKCLLVPTRDDSHPHHKEVNRFSKSIGGVDKGYYSVNLDKKCTLLSDKVRKAKKNALDTCYPSQIKLWNCDARYILFERITRKDHRFFAKVKYNFWGIHKWKDAKNYLKYPHRHLFYVTMLVELFHNDRDIEFIVLKEELIDFCERRFNKLRGMSCEMIGEEIKLYFEVKYPNREVRMEVSEDNENGIVII